MSLRLAIKASLETAVPALGAAGAAARTGEGAGGGQGRPSQTAGAGGTAGGSVAKRKGRVSRVGNE